ncbi:DUF4123 domain-containing protein [Halomonas sp. PR-M31]|uniref:DUF4123 domain-containing protein n=1 Tax=Halomonas sp. PR-M31 TaxID=1471202 RepID=UPI0009E283A5|nr:DUF4123 domain-containing protein [Halomonas sp. PR-M31]
MPMWISRFLVDLSLHKEALRRIFEIEPAPRYQLLYLQTDQHEQANVGPLLIDPCSPVAHRHYKEWVQQGLAIELQGQQRFESVAEHLKTLTMVERERAPLALFRYADPRLYAGLESTLNVHDLRRLLGPNDRMRSVVSGQTWTLQQDSMEADSYTPASAPFRLTRDHLQGIDEWRSQTMLQALAEHYALPVEHIIGWYREIRTKSHNNEQACLEHCHRLARNARNSVTSAHLEEITS